jgi:superfamily II DNA helicase RecQ
LGIHLLVHPLLVLVADKVQRLSSANEAHGPVGAHNLDEELGLSNLSLDRLLNYLRGIGCLAARTVFLFASPQLFASQPCLRRALLDCAKAGTLRSVTLDEAHLLAKWGATFRLKIPALCCRGTQASRRPFLLATTATNSANNMQRLAKIVRCDFPPECRFWPPASSFSQRNIRMEFVVGSGYSGDTDAIVDHLQSSTSEVFVFFNSRGLVAGLQGTIKGKAVPKHVEARWYAAGESCRSKPWRAHLTCRRRPWSPRSYELSCFEVCFTSTVAKNYPRTVPY